MSITSKNSTALKEKTIVITGASSGVGKAAALAFAARGANILLAARREDALRDLAGACEELGAAAQVVITDVKNAEALKALAAKAVEAHGSIDVWINNAGVLAAGPLEETPAEVNEDVIRTNLLGYMHGAAAALPYFKQQGHGVIINNISIGGFVSIPYAGAYSASKAGLRAFSASLRAELSPWKGIYVCDLFPAFLDTPGIGHAANFTGAEIKLSKAILFDPLRVATAMVKLAQHPQAAAYPDFAAPLLKIIYQLFPGLTGVISEKIIRAYFKKAAPAPATSGNVLRPDYSGTSIHGGESKPASGKTSLGKAALLAGLAIGTFAMLRKK